MTRMTMVMSAAGRAMPRLVQNLSFIWTPWVLVAAIVVSEIKERLSPNMEPPTTVATQMGREKCPISETDMAIGTRTVMVPQLVPMAMEIRQAIRKRPGMAKDPGIRLSRRPAVESAPPASLAIPLKAPAIRKMNNMIVILSSPIPLAQMWIFSSKLRDRFCIRATARAMEKASTTDIM